MLTSSLRWCTLLLLACLAIPHSLSAQTGQCLHELTLDSPLPGATGVSVNPEITISCNNSINAGSVNFESPFCVQVTTGTCAPNIFLLPQDIYLNETEANWALFSEYVTCVTVSANQIKINIPTVNSLMFGTKYTLLVRDISCYEDQLMCTQDVDKDWSFAFETVKLPPKLVSWSNSDGKAISCSDKITLEFTEDIGTLTPAGKDLIEVFELGAYQSSNNTYALNSSAVSTVLSQSGANVTVTKTGGWSVGQDYLLYVNQNLLDGDANNKLAFNFSIKEFSTITFTTAVVGTSGSVTTGNLHYSLGEAHTLHSNETEQFSAPQFVNNLYFKRWVCPQDQSFDNSTSLSFSVMQNCASFEELSVTAEYAQIPTQKIRVEISTMGSVFAGGYNSSNAHSTNNCYNLRAGLDTHLELIAIAGNGKNFVKWESDDPNYDQSTTPYLRLKIKDPHVLGQSATPIDMKPVFEEDNNLPAGPCSALALNVTVECQPEAKVDISDLVTLPLLSSWSVNGDKNSDYKEYINSNPPDETIEMIDVSVTINSAYQGCYEIESYTVIGKGSAVVRRAGSEEFPLGGSSVTIDDVVLQNSLDPALQDCSKFVTVRIKRLTKTLTIEAEMNDGKFLPYYSALSLTHNIGKEVQLSNASGVLKSESPNTADMTVKTLEYTYLCGDDAVWLPNVKSWATSTYSANDWECPLGPDPDPVSGLTCQTITDVNTDEITVKMDQDKLIRYEFGSIFRLLQIGFWDANNSGSFIWYNVSGTNTLPEGEQQLVDTYIQTDMAYVNRPGHKYYPQLKFRFSAPLDQTSLESGGIRVRDIGFRNGTDNQKRYDDFGFQTYDYEVGHNGTLEQGGTVAVLDLKSNTNPAVYMCHMNLMQIFVTSQVESSTGTPVQNPITEGKTVATKSPALSVNMYKIRNKMSVDDCWSGLFSGNPDVFVFGLAAYNDGDFVPTALTQASANLRWPSQGVWKGMIRTTKTVDDLMIRVAKLDQEGSLAYGLLMVDEGNGSTADNVANIINGVGDALALLNDPKKDDNTWDIVSKIVKGAATFMRALFGCNDFPMHRSNVRLLKSDNFWSCHRLYNVRTFIRRGHRGDFENRYWLGDN